ncbi:MAG: Gfo/Idh/MocA family protein [Chthonomonadales bacterium]
MSSKQSRRDFLRSAAYGGITIIVGGKAWAKGQSPNERINFACIGVGGKGDSDTADAARFGNIVAICDIDDNTIANALKKYPNAKVYHDYRKMFDEIGKSIDAVTVSTPDHHHALASAHAMHLGKHCFTQKPLTRTIWEARQLANIARRMKVATQMGNQGTADSSMRKNAYLVRAGVLGKVTEVHVWTNRPIWPQGIPRPPEAPCPPNVHWKEWIGGAPTRPYANGYHPFAWRGFWDFGSGALGDMACHTVNLPFMALDLRNPVSVVAETSGNNKESFPKWSIIHFQFPATHNRPAVKMTWYDGGKLPPIDLFTGGRFSDLVVDGKISDSGSLIIGDKDKLYTPGDYGGGGRFIYATDLPDVSYPESPGHFEEFIRAIKEGKPAMSNFPDYAGPLTETILLGNLAVWADGKKIEWDPKNLRALNAPEVAHIIKPIYHNGYAL